MITVKRSSANDRDFEMLVAQLDADLRNRYGNLQEEYDKLNKLDLSAVTIVAYDEDVPVGCGCYKVYNNNTVELKRIFVTPGCRRK